MSPPQVYRSNHLKQKSLSVITCHHECINLSRFEFLCVFSVEIDDPFHTIHHNDFTRVDNCIIKIMRRFSYEIEISDICSGFRMQFVNILKQHQSKIRKQRLWSCQRKGQRYLELLKHQRYKICCVGQPAKRINILPEKRYVRGILGRIATAEKKSVVLENLLSAQKSKNRRLKRYLGLKTEKLRQARVKKQLKIRNFSVSNLTLIKRRSAISQFLRKAAQENGIILQDFKYCVVGSDKVEYSGTASASRKVDPQLASRIVDATQLSLRKYNVMQKMLPSIFPSLHQVTAVRKSMNEVIPAHEFRTDVVWYARVSFFNLLCEQLETLILAGRFDITSDTVKIKLSGDGTWVSRHTHIVSLCFVIVIEGETCQKATDVCNIVLARCKEDRHDLEYAFQDALDEIKETVLVTVLGKTYNIKYYVSADYKFLLILTGIKSVSSDCPCIYCVKKKTEFRNYLKSAEKRTIENMGSKSQGLSGLNPLISFAPVENYIIDHLHLKLRISDQKLKFLVDEMSRLDAEDKLKKPPGVGGNIAKLEAGLELIGIQYAYRIDAKKKAPIINLRGTDYDLFLDNFDVDTVCPKLDSIKRSNFATSLTSFNAIMHLLRQVPLPNDGVKQFTTLLKKWHKATKVIIIAKGFTPYMHILSEHVTRMLQIHGSIYPFANEGVERFNCLATKRFMGQSNHKSGSLQQVMQAAKREILHSRSTPTYVAPLQCCSSCGQKGHKKRTCKENVTPSQSDNERPVRKSRRLLFSTNNASV